MALSTFTELKAALATFSGRTDQTSNWPDFITLAEAQMERELRTRQMTIRADATINEEFEDLPEAFGEAVSFYIKTTPPRLLQYVTADQMASISASYGSTTGDPQFFTIVGPQFRFLPVPAASVTGELTYFQRIPPLALNDQNWLLYRHPDAYLYGALMQYAIFSGDERLSSWSAAFSSAIDAIKRSDHSLGPALQPRATYAV